MPLIYITGIAGSGKSTVLEELSNRGFEVYDADEELTAWEHKATRQRIAASDHTLTTDPKFFEEYDWYIDRQGVHDLAKSTSDKTVFLGGSVANESEVWSEFDKVFCLYVDDALLEQRVMNRADKDFGKSEHELEHLLTLNREVVRKYSALGAIPIDASMSKSGVVDEILAKLEQ
jgi:dephospho-CoA kinase